MNKTHPYCINKELIKYRIKTGIEYFVVSDHLN